MKFLRVFCVVLCVRSGAFLHIQNNVPDIHYQNQGAIPVSAHKNTKIPINHPYYDEYRNQPIGRFSEQFKPQKTSEYVHSQQIKNKNEQFLNEENYTGNQGLYLQDQTHPKFINPPARSLNEAQYNQREEISKSTLQENMRLESSRISPKYLNWQQIKNTNENINNQEDSNSQRVQQFQAHPEYILPEAKGFNEVQRKLQFSDMHEPIRLSVLPPKPVDVGSVLTKPKNIISQPINHLIEAKHMPVEDKTLELQAVAPEYINSLINEDKTELNAKLSLASPYENVDTAAVAKYLDNKKLNSRNFFKQDEATYENPSAEILYTTKQALPYEIEEQQFPNISQGGFNSYNNQDSRRIQDIQKFIQPSKRYMIIHPDGRVEHIDEIEKIIKIHPNYVMIESQDFLKHIEGKSISGLKIPQLYAKNLYDSIVSQKHNEVPHHPADIPSGQKSSSQLINNPLYTKVTDSVGKLSVSNEPKVYPTQVKTVKVNSHTSPESIDDENQLLNKKHMATQLLPAIENHEENNNIRNKQTIRQLAPYAKENEFKKIESTSMSPRDVKQIQSENEQQTSEYNAALLSSTIANITEKNNVNSNETVITKVNKTEKASLPLIVNLTLKDNLPIPPQNRQITLNNASEQPNLNTLLVPKISTKTATVSTNNNIKNINQTAALPTLNSNKTGIGAIQLKISNGTFRNGIVPDNTKVFNKNPEILPDLNHEMSDTLSTTSGPENGVLSINTTTTSAPIRKETSLSKNIQKHNTNKNDASMPTLNMTSPSTTPLSNSENTTNNTGFWFQADEQFWQNIMNDTQNLFYFFFVPPKTNIMQRETKITLYPNGTTIEEVSETIDDDSVPRVIKTTKVFVNSTSTDA